MIPVGIKMIQKNYGSMYLMLILYLAHKNRYVNEFAFRWNTRKMNDDERVVLAIKGADSKRLMYGEPITKMA